MDRGTSRELPDEEQEDSFFPKEADRIMSVCRRCGTFSERFPFFPSSCPECGYWKSAPGWNGMRQGGIPKGQIVQLPRTTTTTRLYEQLIQALVSEAQFKLPPVQSYCMAIMTYSSGSDSIWQGTIIRAHE
eukprot:g23108.t1